MAYTAAQHAVFVARCKAAVRAMQDLREELARLDSIYVNEAASGADAEFADTAEYTEQQIINVISLKRDLDKFFGNESVSAGWRSVWLSPFLI
jgi:hypothetical protein